SRRPEPRQPLTARPNATTRRCQRVRAFIGGEDPYQGGHPGWQPGWRVGERAQKSGCRASPPLRVKEANQTRVFTELLTQATGPSASATKRRQLWSLSARRSLSNSKLGGRMPDDVGEATEDDDPFEEPMT